MPIDISWDILYQKLFDLINHLTRPYSTLTDMLNASIEEDRTTAIRIDSMADITRKNPEALYQSALTLMRDGYSFASGVNVPVCKPNGKLIMTDYDARTRITMLTALRQYLHNAYARTLRSMNGR